MEQEHVQQMAVMQHLELDQVISLMIWISLFMNLSSLQPFLKIGLFENQRICVVCLPRSLQWPYQQWNQCQSIVKTVQFYHLSSWCWRLMLFFVQVQPWHYPGHLHLSPSHPWVPLPPLAKHRPLEMITSLSASPSLLRLQARSHTSSVICHQQNKSYFHLELVFSDR